MPTPDDYPIQIIRSKRRKKSISGEIKNGTLIIRAPQRISDQELQPHIESLKKKLARSQKRRRAPQTDDALETIARQLNREHFGGELKWASIRYVTNQRTRYGSCTPATGEIRISDRLKEMPKWVLTYVVMHEISHLIEANHSKSFWDLVNRYSLSERARGYLMAVGMETDDG
jgi:predicted metal-dependent hydrolase